VPSAAVIRDLGPAEFRAGLEQFVAVYAAAMQAEQDQLPGRLANMQRHASYPGFRALMVAAEPDGPAVAFAYCFRGAAGQWWHDIVTAGVTAARGRAAAADWMGDAIEIAEVHVLPGHQHRGIGRSMLLALTAGRAERTAVLSTQDTRTPARRLYRSLGFTDLLTSYAFPGNGVLYAVMGARLPLRGAAAQAAHPGQGPAGAPGGPDRPQPRPGPSPRPSSW